MADLTAYDLQTEAQWVNKTKHATYFSFENKLTRDLCQTRAWRMRKNLRVRDGGCEPLWTNDRYLHNDDNVLIKDVCRDQD